jgi:hypothetical protein
MNAYPFEEISEETVPAGPEDIVKHREPICKINLPRESIVECEVQLCEGQDDVLVEVVADHEADSSIAKSSMKNEKTLEESKLAEGIVARSDGLRSLFAPDSYSNVSLQDHGDIVRTITNGQGDPLALVLCELYNIRLLLGCYSAADDRGSMDSKLEK